MLQRGEHADQLGRELAAARGLEPHRGEVHPDGRSLERARPRRQHVADVDAGLRGRRGGGLARLLDLLAGRTGLLRGSGRDLRRDGRGPQGQQRRRAQSAHR